MKVFLCNWNSIKTFDRRFNSTTREAKELVVLKTMPKNDSSVVNYDARVVNWSNSICGLLYPLRSSETTCQRDYWDINLIS